MAYVLVDDPSYAGKPPAPQILRSWAMRKLHEGGMSIGDVARHYGTSYLAAWKAINPARGSADQAARRGSKLKEKLEDPASISKVPKAQLLRIATAKHATLDDPKVAAAVAELDRRDPKWFEA